MFFLHRLAILILRRCLKGICHQVIFRQFFRIIHDRHLIGFISRSQCCCILTVGQFAGQFTVDLCNCQTEAHCLILINGNDKLSVTVALSVFDVFKAFYSGKQVLHILADRKQRIQIVSVNIQCQTVSRQCGHIHIGGCNTVFDLWIVFHHLFQLLCHLSVIFPGLVIKQQEEGKILITAGAQHHITASAAGHNADCFDALYGLQLLHQFVCYRIAFRYFHFVRHIDGHAHLAATHFRHHDHTG